MGLSVLHPALLIAGLLCVAIPVLIHLLRRKHRPISWGAMRFLEQAYRKRRRLITIEQLLLLLARCAIIALIAGAVGALALGSQPTDLRATTMVIVLDNSIHSAATLQSGQPSIEYQKQRALQLLSSLDPTQGDRAALITAAAPALGDATPATSELGLIRSRIQSIQATDAQRDLDGALELVSSVLANITDDSTHQTILVLSSGGWNTDTQHIQHQLPHTTSVLLDAPPLSTAANTAVVDAQPLRPILTRRNTNDPQDEIHGLRVLLNRSDSSLPQSNRIVITDTITDAHLATANLNWSIGQSHLNHTIMIDPDSLSSSRGGSALLRVTIADADANPRDNTRQAGLPIRQHITIGIIDSFAPNSDSGIRPSRWVRAVLNADDGLMSIQQINANSASNRIDPTLDALYLLSPSALNQQGWDRIAQLNAKGMPIIITPDASPNSADWISNLKSRSPQLITGDVTSQSFDPPIGLANTLDSKHKLLSGIRDEYPDLASSVTISRRLNLQPGPNTTVLLHDSQGQPLAVVSQNNNTNHPTGPIVLWGVAFDARWTDLPARPLFVAITHELLRSLLAQSIAPDSRLAGQSAARLEFDTLEPLANSTPNPRIAGVFVSVNKQGTGQRAVIINPDASLSAANPSTLDSPLLAVAKRLPNIKIQEISTNPDLSSNSIALGSTPERSIALTLFGIAAILGVIELLLARRCSYQSLDHHAPKPRGTS